MSISITPQQVPSTITQTTAGATYYSTQPTVGSTYYTNQPATTSSVVPPSGPMIDEKIVMKQKEKALRELESRVKLALQQHDQMYQLQKSHINADHDRQMEYTKGTIEKERQAALFDLEGQYQTNNRGLEQAAIQQRMQIETTAMQLDIQAHQQKMVQEHQERERKRTGQVAGMPPAAYPGAPVSYPYYTAQQSGNVIYSTIQQPSTGASPAPQ
ncbi:hypothetical protein Pmar_PMAR006454 [Perkinsus marinus ATCC 50983]|uniref:Uncharacterized protein n=1 Tax=Perkinsus marinus (strain ATCC 50983 / TXsc) TaxID=423536 RepID=C5K9Q8_PERM5|nr:hypothetical protein Pmar_PMAR006454 [Perkinsus marinus ATCC 50983]EER18830.1 hypothetical protein Pmar_PMAR006454 [Perkinsus marinus ATCC 50983]|eukprot:XP_002787034.1 hypothetical protein Pmar_PMAR006454 [Perkinsus marinus ATCC 50983]